MLLVTVFAIGSCYDSIAESRSHEGAEPASTDQHQRFFSSATSVAQNWASQHTEEHVCALLAQCFYLLATCQTDRCWTTLGMAVRVAQSLGLHVEGDQYAACETSLVSRETCRRLWYSLFVLDRLVALQLGRPPAIADRNFNVQIPSRMGGVDQLGDNLDCDESQQEGSMSYFLAVIEFSKIIGRVYDSLYGPRKADSAASTLSIIDGLDIDLLNWKSSLPRSLRFDLPHTFESSITLKRQVCLPQFMALSVVR